MDSTSKSTLLPMARSGNGSKGQKTRLLTNHFNVNFTKPKSQYFFHYNVRLSYFPLLSCSHIKLLWRNYTVGFNLSLDIWTQVAITYEDGSPVEGTGIGRKILENVKENYQYDLGSKHFAYDGEKNLFTIGPLPSSQLDFSVVLVDMSSSRNAGKHDDADSKRLRRPNRSKNFKVSITFAAKIPIQSIANALQGKETKHFQDAIRVLDVILRQNAARQK